MGLHTDSGAAAQTAPESLQTCSHTIQQPLNCCFMFPVYALTSVKHL